MGKWTVIMPAINDEMLSTEIEARYHKIIDGALILESEEKIQIFADRHWMYAYAIKTRADAKRGGGVE